MFRLKITDKTKQFEMYENADYETFWEGVQQMKLDELEQILVQKMLHLPAKRMIDVGCGYGRLLNRYQPYCDEVILLDSSHSLLQQAYKNSNNKAICMACDLNNLPFADGAFDQVMMVRVFHHLDHPDTALGELSRILTGGGHFLFSYCNKMNLDRVFRWLIRKNPYNPFVYETAWVWNVFFMHHPRYVHDLLRKAGFEKFVERGAGVVDKIAGKLGDRGRKFPPGVAVAPLLAVLAIAPWIFIDTRKSGERGDTLDLPFSEIIRCTKCHNKLAPYEEGYQCTSCGSFFRKKDGVISFI